MLDDGKIFHVPLLAELVQYKWLCNLQSQYNCHQNSNGILSRIRKKFNLRTHMKPQKTMIGQSNPKKKEHSLKFYHTWPQIIPQIYSNWPG